MIDRLLKAGADPNAPLTAGGDTALMMAARTGKTDAIRVLVEAGANVNAKETWGGTTALMWAVSEGHADAARLLLVGWRRRQRAIALRRGRQRPRLRGAHAGGEQDRARRSRSSPAAG